MKRKVEKKSTREENKKKIDMKIEFSIQMVLIDISQSELPRYDVRFK